MTDKYKVGDLPPDGYRETWRWFLVQQAGGLEQSVCKKCKQWLFPQEVKGHKCTKGEGDELETR